MLCEPVWSVEPVTLVVCYRSSIFVGEWCAVRVISAVELSSRNMTSNSIIAKQTGIFIGARKFFCRGRDGHCGAETPKASWPRRSEIEAPRLVCCGFPLPTGGRV